MSSDKTTSDSTDDNSGAIGTLSRKEIATLVAAVTVFLIIIVSAIIYGKIIFSASTFDQITVTGSIDIGVFEQYFSQLFTASLIILGMAAAKVMSSKSSDNTNSKERNKE